MRFTRAVIAVAAMVVIAAGCGGQSATQKSEKASGNLQSQVYQAKHNIEFRNYNLRQKLSDDPSTILWCTFFPPTTGQEPFTVPIAGKLTSSGKRPYRAVDNNGDEAPGPDHMYGDSVDYRYGFDPTLTQYSDFTFLPSYCTNTPTVWQANQTNVVVNTATTMNSLTNAAEAAIRAKDPKKALALLQEAGTAANNAQDRKSK